MNRKHPMIKETDHDRVAGASRREATASKEVIVAIGAKVVVLVVEGAWAGDEGDEAGAGWEGALAGQGEDAGHHLGDVDPVEAEGVLAFEGGDKSIEFGGAAGVAA